MALLGFTRSLLFRESVEPTCPPAQSPRIFLGSFVGILLFYFSLLCPAHAEPNKEYQIKAAFIFNFAQFVQWPDQAFSSSDSPFYIGILGDDPFGSLLEKTIQGESIDQHKLVVRRSQSFEDLKNCQLLFISKSEEDHLSEILSKVDTRPVLTVSEMSRFCQNGGAIGFYLQGNKVRFEINPRAAQRGGLKISSQLLSLGKIVTP